MSNAITQNATKLAISNPTGDWDSEQFADSARRATERKAKGVTQERLLLKRNELISMVCADYRSHFPAVFGPKDRLPEEVFAKVESAVDSKLEAILNRVNPNNAISYRRWFHFNSAQLSFTERNQVVGENAMTLEQQHFAATVTLGELNKQLTRLYEKKTPDYDREKAVKDRIRRVEIAQMVIEKEMKSQEQLKS